MDRIRWTGQERQRVYQRVFELFDLHKTAPVVSDGAFVMNKELIETFVKAQADLHIPKSRRRDRLSHYETTVALPKFRERFNKQKAPAAKSLAKIGEILKHAPPQMKPSASVIMTAEDLKQLRLKQPPSSSALPGQSLDEVVNKAIHAALEPYHKRLVVLEEATETFIATIDELIGLSFKAEERAVISEMIVSYKKAIAVPKADAPKLKRVAVIGIHDHLVEPLRREFEGKLKLSIYHGRERGINYKSYDHVVFMVDHANHSKYQGVKSGTYAAGVSLVHVNGGVSSLRTELQKIL